MKETERKKLDRMEKMVELIESSPITKKLREDAAAENLTIRKAAAEKIKVLQKEAAALIPVLRAAITDAETELKNCENHRKELEIKLSVAVAAMPKATFDLDRNCQRQEAVLRSSYDEKIDDEILFYRNKIDGLMKPGKIHQHDSLGEMDVFTMARAEFTRSNIDAINATLIYCRAAIDELEKMKLAPDLDMGLIEALRGGIPDENIMVEYGGSRNTPGAGIDDPHRILWKSQGELRGVIDVITEKYHENVEKLQKRIDKIRI